MRLEIQVALETVQRSEPISVPGLEPCILAGQEPDGPTHEVTEASQQSGETPDWRGHVRASSESAVSGLI